MIVFVIAIALPGAFSFANEANQTQAATSTPSNTTISGVVNDASTGQPIADAKKAYVQIAYAYYDGELQLGEEKVDVKGGKYSIPNIPSLPLVGSYGVITAGAEGYANEILTIQGASGQTKKDFTLGVGSPCTFVNDEELEDYYLCVGSSVTTADGLSVKLPEDIGDIAIGEGLPLFGAPEKATFTENKAAGTLTYHYKAPSGPEEYNIIFKAEGVTGHNFKK